MASLIPPVAPAFSQITGLDATVNWSKLPNVGDRRGVWIFSDKSMPWLLAGKYDVINIAPTTQTMLSITGNLMPEAGLGIAMPYEGMSYYLKKANELYRCDEIGLGKRYVICWRFQPDIVEGKVIINPTRLVGTWKSPAIETPITITFSDDTMTSNDGREIIPYTASFSGNTATVNVDGGRVIFEFQNDTTISFRSPQFNGRIVVLTKQ